MLKVFFLSIFEKLQAAEATTPTTEDTVGTIQLPIGEGTKTTIATVLTTINTVKDMLVGFIYGGALLFFLIGVYNYITSYGNDAKAQKAKQTMLWSVIGLVVVIMASFIINFVANLLGFQSKVPELK
ncbi:MAG: hypothetical protein WC523_07540 [Patescibacteria group bacterium]